MKINTDGVLLGAWADAQGKRNILDIGTGTGVIALMLSQKEPIARIHAIEIDEPSALEAAQNVQQSPFSDRVQVVHQSIQDFSTETQLCFDLIVSNPPFFSGGTFSQKRSNNLVKHTVKLTHGDRLDAVRNLLSPTGQFQCILPIMEGMRFIELAAHYHLYLDRCTEVYPDQDKKIERLLISMSKITSTHPITDQLYIRDHKTGDFSKEYKYLTQDFYLNF